jgi:hypothetical protein
MSPTARQANPIKINRVQVLVLAFLLMAWLSLVVILVAAPEVYELRLRSLPGPQPVVAIVFVLALTAFIVFLSIGVLRRWRWTFWLILIAFLFGGAAHTRGRTAVIRTDETRRTALVRHPARRYRRGAGPDRAGDGPGLSALGGLGILKWRTPSNCLTGIHEPITECACDPPTDAAQLPSPGRGSRGGAVGV